MEQDRRRNPEQEGIGMVSDRDKVIELLGNLPVEYLDKVSGIINLVKMTKIDQDTAAVLSKVSAFILLFNNLRKELDRELELDKVIKILAVLGERPENIEEAVKASVKALPKM